MRHGSPALARGIKGARITRQSARPGPASSRNPGAAAGSRRLRGRERRPQIIRALVIGRKVASEQCRFRSAGTASVRPASRRSSGTRNSNAQTKAETGLPGRPSTCIPPRRPCISGRPGRSADLPERQRHALRGQRLLHEIVIADRGAAGGHQARRRRRSRARRIAAIVSSRRSGTMPRSITSAPSPRARAVTE